MSTPTHGLRTLPTYPHPSHHQTFAVGTKAEAVPDGQATFDFTEGATA